MLSGDTGLIVDILEGNDQKTGSRSLTTITSAADDITYEELEKAHGARLKRHAGSARARGTQTSYQASRLARCSETGDFLSPDRCHADVVRSACERMC